MKPNLRFLSDFKKWDKYFPLSHQTVPHAEENLLFIQRECTSIFSKVTTSFSVAEKTVIVSFRTRVCPQTLDFLNPLAPLTEKIVFSKKDDEVSLYIKYYADPSPQERAIRYLFLQKEPTD